jgi:hypothetical protein
VATWPGAALGLGAAVLFLVTVAGYFRRRLVRRLEPAFGHVAIGFGCLVLALAAGMVQLVLPGMSARGWIVYAELTLLGWLVVFITGIWDRLFTVLVWLHVYGAGGTRTRTAAELVHPGTAWIALGLLAIGIALLVGGTAGASAEAAGFGAWAFLAGSVLVVGQHARIFHGRA